MIPPRDNMLFSRGLDLNYLWKESVGHSMELPKTDLLLFGLYYPRLPNILQGDIWTQIFGCLGLHSQMVIYNEPL